MRTVIAGYHWFTDWGRDTMISLEGLTLATGRAIEARWILRTFAHYVRDGLIPNLFPEGQNQGLYHTADATLWFFHALHRYVEHTGTRTTLKLLLPTLKDIVEHHLAGTRFGIKVDPRDGLLTPGRGRLSAHLDGCQSRRLGGDAAARQGGRDQRALVQCAAVAARDGCVEAEDAAGAEVSRADADKARESFNRRFWHEEGGYLYDVVDGENGDDASLSDRTRFSRFRSIIRSSTRVRLEVGRDSSP